MTPLFFLCLFGSNSSDASPCAEAQFQQLRAELRLALDPTPATASDLETEFRATYVAPLLSKGESCVHGLRSLEGGLFGEFRRELPPSTPGDPLMSAPEATVDGLSERVQARIERLVAAHPDRYQRFSAAVQPLSADDSDYHFVLEWAMQELLPGPDPRQWAPRDVAFAVFSLRSFRKTPLPTKGGPESLLFERAWKRVARMGHLTVADLVGPEAAIKLPSSNAEQEIERNRGAVPAPVREHFPFESTLYRTEWDRLNAGARHDRDSLISREKYVLRRWRETDALLPKPDLDRVRRELRHLENEETSEE